MSKRVTAHPAMGRPPHGLSTSSIYVGVVPNHPPQRRRQPANHMHGIELGRDYLTRPSHGTTTMPTTTMWTASVICLCWSNSPPRELRDACSRYTLLCAHEVLSTVASVGRWGPPPASFRTTSDLCCRQSVPQPLSLPRAAHAIGGCNS